MSSIVIEYSIDNQAFDDTPLPETRRIFAEICELISGGHGHGIITDCNGNSIGTWKIDDYEARYEEE